LEKTVGDDRDQTDGFTIQFNSGIEAEPVDAMFRVCLDGRHELVDLVNR
jgi:hypothetical protein